MPDESSSDVSALERIVLRSEDGATAEVHAHGAHVTSWRPAPGDVERLFLSARSEFRPGAAIRGGIPIIFPQFAGEGPLPRHGFARTSRWTLDMAERGSATFSLTDSDATRAIWTAPFHAQLTVRIGGQRLLVTFAVENTGDADMSFTAALHTYIRVQDIGNVELVGLHGAPYRLSGAPGELTFDHDETIRVTGMIDRVYVGAPRHLLLREPPRRMNIESEGFPDVVVWNPGAGNVPARSDMEPGGDRRMLCVEAAVVQTPIVLEAGRRWSGSQTLVVLPPET